MSSLPRKNINFPALTGLRGVGAVWVVMFHAQNQLHLPITGLGYLGVDMFFLLSGFVLSLAHRDLKLSWPEYGNFLQARVARIFPMHWAALALLAVIIVLYPRIYNDNAQPYGLQGMLSSILLVQNWGFGRNFPWNSPAWSLSTEWLASLAFPLFLVVARRVNGRLPAAALAFTLLLAWILYIPLSGHRDGNLGAAPGILRTFCEFAAGCLLYRLHFDCWRVPRSAVVAGAVLILVGLAAPRFASLMILGFPMLILLAASPPNLVSRTLSLPLAVFTGEISYSVYLLHWPLMLVSDRLKIAANAHHFWANIWFCGYFAIVIGLSTLTYRYIEIPARRSLREFGRKPLRPVRLAAELGST